MRNTFILMILAALIMSCSTDEKLVGDNPPEAPAICLNEFMARNASTIADENGEYDDWVELYNTTDEPIDLEGYYLTDDPEEYDKWQFPPVTILPHGFLLIWCDEDSSQGALHASLKLSGSGETLMISSDEGSMIDQYTYFEQNDDISEGRMPDGSSQWQFFINPTPGSSNQ